MYNGKFDENVLLFSPKFIKQREYWVNKLSGFPENIDEVELSFGSKMQSAPGNEFEKVNMVMTDELSHRLFHLSNNNDLTLYIILLAGLKSLIYRYTHSQSIMVVSPVYEPNISSETINDFLLICTRIEEGVTFKNLLLDIRQSVLEAYENQDYPFEKLIQYLSTQANTHFDPWVSHIRCSLKNIHDDTNIKNPGTVVHFSFTREENRITGEILYAANVYEAFYVEQMARHFQQMLGNLVRDVNIKIFSAPFLSEKDKKKLIYELNDNRAWFPRDKTIYRYIETYAAASPHRAAIEFEENVITYQELNQRTNQWAKILKDKGLQHEEPVGILLERGPLMVESILGTWKAGGSYIPLDPQDPGPRIKEILKDSHARFLLTDSHADENIRLSTLQNLQKNDQEMVITGTRPPITDFDSVPFPDRSLIDYEKYAKNIGIALVGHSISIQGSRGCPYNCAYCHKIWPKKNIARSAENIFSEVKLYYDMGIRRFAIIDDIFNFHRKNSMTFFHLLIHRGLDVKLFFPNGLRGDLLDSEYIDLMIEAGTTGLALALETASPGLQKLIKKNLNLDKLEQNIQYICSKYPHVILELFTMLGFPTETEEEALKTLNFIKRQKWLHFPYVEILKIFPNTDMEALALEAGISKEAITRSQHLAYHELPDTLPFDKQFALKYQAEFFSKYFLSKERLLHVLPWQMKCLTENEMVQKYDSYLPVNINSFQDLLDFTGISENELGGTGFIKDHQLIVPGLHEKMKRCFPKPEPDPDALKVLLLDLSQYFSQDSHILYDVMEPPLGLMYLMTYINHHFPGIIRGKIAKSRMDFNSNAALKQLLEEFAPGLIGIRTLTYYKDFFHNTVALIREWGFNGTIVVGGPYASSDYETILLDRNVDIIVRGEGEATFSELIGNIIRNKGTLPDEEVLKRIAGLAFSPRKSKESQRSYLEIFKPDTLENQRQKKSGNNSEYSTSPQDLAYIIYTSGSTGKPKGAMIEHAGMMNHIHAKINELNIQSESIVSQNSSHTFDISVWQFFAALVAGGKTIIYPNHLIWEPNHFLSCLARDRVTILEVVPSYLSAIVDTLNMNTADKNYPVNIRYLLVTGEEVKLQLVKKAVEKFPGIKVVNAYGPTEVSDDITHHIMDRIPDAGRIPIGKTVQNLNIYIVDKDMQLCPAGVKGELVVSGIGVGRGYLNEVEKTRQSFTMDPFVDEKGCKLYKTGDLALRSPNGIIEFFGRKDQQVKIAGFRIECGEIESKLIAHPDVDKAVVLVKTMADVNTGQENKTLRAYVKVNGILSTQSMKEYLQANLPYYLVPTHFVEVKEIPLTSNGKIDRKALLDMDIEPGGKYIPPRSDLEKALAKIWAEVLEIEKIGINDNFFELGGNSIKGIRAMNRIQNQLSEIVHVTMLFETPTIEGLARMIENHRTIKHSRINTSLVSKFRRVVIPPLPPMEITGARNPTAVFILSSPRSGTTLLRMILAGHPQLFSPPELELLSFNTLQDRKKVISGKYGYLTEGTIRVIMELKNCSSDKAEKIMKEFEDRGTTTREFYRIMQGWMQGRTLVDKTPYYSLNIDVLGRAEVYFDNPRYIHLIRNPYAMIHSYEKAKMNQVFWYQNDFSVTELAELIWVVSHQNIMNFLESIPANRKHAVRFEDLVRDPGAVVGEMCDFLGIEYDEKMIQVYENTESKMANGIHPESKMLGDFNFFTHSAIDPRVLDKWKNDYKTDFLGDITIDLAKKYRYLEAAVALDYTGLVPVLESEYYELSNSQKRLWILHQMEPNHAVYNIPIAYLLEGDLNVEVLAKSFEIMVKRHETLRTTFVMVDGEPRQKIHRFEDQGFKLEYFDLRTTENPGMQAKALVQSESALSFNLEKGPLLRIKLFHVDEKQYVFLLNMHHIVSDGWSMRILTEEVLTLYEAYIMNNPKDPLPPLRFQYKDYSAWQNSKTMREILKNQEDYWLKELEGEIPVLNLAADYPRPPVQGFEGNAVGFGISKEETTALNKMTHSQGVTLFMVLLAIFNVFLSKISSQDDIVVGTPISGRSHPDLEYIIGMFVNTLAIRSFPTAGKTFLSFLKETRKKVLKAFDNQDFQFEELVEKVTLQRDVSRNPLFDIMFTIGNNIESGGGNLQRIENREIKIKPYFNESTTSKFDITLSAVRNGDTLGFGFEYCTKLFKKETILRFTTYFRNTLSWIIRYPQIKLSGIEIISEEEKNRVLYEFNAAKEDYPREKTIHRLFEQQVERTPDHTAVIGMEHGAWSMEKPLKGTGGLAPLYITYRELNQKSNQLAYLLKEKGIHPDTIVGVMVERSVEMIIGILGILKAGGAYLPIEPDYPAERINYMLKDSNAQSLVVDDTSCASWLSFPLKSLLNLSEGHHLNFPASQLPGFPTSLPSSLAYIIYTSGTTGKPKGTLIEHRSLVNLCCWHNRYYTITKNDRAAQYAQIVFDAAVWEIFPYIVKGASLHIIDDRIKLDVEQIAAYFVRCAITIAFLPTQICQQFMEAAAGISSLRTLLTGGDKLNRFIKGNYTLYNNYGPTENTVVTTSVLVDTQSENIPIGSPISNNRVLILDKNSRYLQPMGIPGELCIAGESLARGYLNQPELTAEKFDRDLCDYWDYHDKKLLPGSRGRFSRKEPPGRRRQKIYRTGDLARWLPDGNIEFSGRIDHQVKIRGLRIELREIESLLLKHAEIKDVVVIDRQREQGERYLCTYFTGAREIPVSEFREYLSTKLPAYMIPTYFIRMEILPLTSSNKIDRRLLPLPDDRPLPDNTFAAPRDDMEKAIVEVWREVLNLDKIGIYDNFFDLGGNSLSIIKVNNKIKTRLEIEIPLVKMFRYSTIDELARHISREEKKDAFSDEQINESVSMLGDTLNLLTGEENELN